MPKVNPPASNIQKFTGLMREDFQGWFDTWNAETERAENGTLEITHEEVISQGAELLIFYRVVPRPALARLR